MLVLFIRFRKTFNVICPVLDSLGDFQTSWIVSDTQVYTHMYTNVCIYISIYLSIDRQI